jgi:photosystem II stability/assembly factor-like uncharacterized protein
VSGHRRTQLAAVAVAVALGSTGCYGPGRGAHPALRGADPLSAAQAAAAHPVASRRAASRQAVAPRGGLPAQEVFDFTPISSAVTWAVTLGNQSTDSTQSVLRTVDGGARWSNVTPAGLRLETPNRTISSVFFLNSRRGWIEYGNDNTGPQRLIETTDSGRHWRSLIKIPVAGCNIQFVNWTDGWCTELGGALGSEGVKIYRTTTGGRRWRLVSVTNPPGQKSTRGALPWGCDKSIGFSTASTGFAGFACNGGWPPIYATRDGGARWIPTRVVRHPVPIGDGGAWFSAPIVAGGKGAVSLFIGGGPKVRSETVVFRSTNGGRVWRAVTTPGPATHWVADIVTPTRWHLVSGRTVLSSDDGGRTWSTIKSDKRLTTSAVAPGIDFVTPRVGWDIASGGPDPLRTTDGGRIWRRVPLPGGSI